MSAPVSTKTIAGWFRYVAAGAGWEDSFKVVDDDGMPFVLDELKQFQGYAVRITITLDPEADAKSQADTTPEPLIYRMIGMTRAQARKERA